MIRNAINAGTHMKYVLILLVVALSSPLSAVSADQLVRVEKDAGNEVNEVTFKEQKRVVDRNARATSVTLDGVARAVIFPDAAAGISLDHVNIINGNEGMQEMPWIWRVYTKGELRVRATVRYGWFDGFESYDDNQPILEIFVHPDFALKLPRFEDNTAGWVDYFTVDNEEQVLKSLFSPKILQLIHTKKLLFAEQDSELVLDAINFVNECGNRYGAKVKSSAPWANSKVASRSSGWEIHC
jgi:hypothetical protein